MSDLISNLNSIYNVKLQIKDVIGTDSDTFSEYPSLIEEAIAGGVSGYSYIIANGDYDISTYEMVNVNVPVPPGYVFPTGTYNITENGTFSVSEYQNAYVSVQSSPVSIVPDTFQDITKAELEATTDLDPIFAYTQRCLYTYMISGTHAGKYMEAVGGANFIDAGIQWYDDEVPTGSDGSLYYFSGNNPNIRNTTRTISDNGYYKISDNDPIQNYGDIYINVSGGGPSTTTVSGQYLIGKGGSGDEYTINRGFYYVYDSNTSTYYTLTQALGNPVSAPKLGDTVSVTGTILSGNIITPTSYSVTGVPAYEYVDLSNFELYGTGDKEIAYVVNGVGISDRITTYDNKWGYYPGGDYYNIIADSVSNISFTAGNDLTAYIVSEAVEEEGYYGYTYYIREVVINRSPIITGLEYSVDHGENWSSATFDSTDMVYNINGISISDSDMVGLNLRADIGNGNYLYLGDTNLEISNIGVDVSDSLNKSRTNELSTGIMNQTGSAGTVSATISTVNSTISARITA